MQVWVWYVLGGFIALVALLVISRMARRALRLTLLRRQFDNEDFVQTIMAGRIAQGMSRDMVEASWGRPADFDERVMKTKTKQEMKYDQTGKNRFGTRVYLEDGLVVGWETK